jgi:hypothetical protein
VALCWSPFALLFSLGIVLKHSASSLPPSSPQVRRAAAADSSEVRRAVKEAGVTSCVWCAKQAAAAGVDHLRTCKRCLLARSCSEECQVCAVLLLSPPPTIIHSFLAAIYPAASQRADWPAHKRVCEEAIDKPVRVGAQCGA